MGSTPSIVVHFKGPPAICNHHYMYSCAVDLKVGLPSDVCICVRLWASNSYIPIVPAYTCSPAPRVTSDQARSQPGVKGDNPLIYVCYVCWTPYKPPTKTQYRPYKPPYKPPYTPYRNPTHTLHKPYRNPIQTLHKPYRNPIHKSYTIGLQTQSNPTATAARKRNQNAPHIFSIHGISNRRTVMVASVLFIIRTAASACGHRKPEWSHYVIIEKKAP